MGTTVVLIIVAVVVMVAMYSVSHGLRARLRESQTSSETPSRLDADAGQHDAGDHAGHRHGCC